MSRPVVAPRGDPWRDLIYHALAHLPVAGSDASSLYHEGYQGWAHRRLPRPEDPRRTLVQDAGRLATLYDAAPTAHGLQGFAALHRDLEAFLRSARHGLSDSPWPDEAEAEGLRGLAGELSVELVELFRIALWGEIQAGYLELHESTSSAHAAAATTLSRGLLRLQEDRLPGLGEVDWCLSYALCRAGRLDLPPESQRRRVTVGVSDTELDVPPWAPLIQGVHEYLLSEVLVEVSGSGRATTRPDRAGFGDFFGPELLTLCLDCRALATGTTAEPLRRWLGGYYPDGEVDLAPQLAQASITPGRTCPAGPDAFVTWLARGSVLPPPLRVCYETLVDRLELG